MGRFERWAVTGTILLLIAPSACSQAAHPAEKPPSTYDKIWTFADWYDNKSNPVVQKVLFTGRYQQDFADVGADQGSMDEWNVRRLRLGPKITLFHNYLVH